MTSQMQTLDRPIYVGRYLSGAGAQFHPISQREADRARAAAVRILDTFEIKDRDHLLMIATTAEVAQCAPINAAAQAKRMILMSADNSPYEAHRMEAVLRRFPITIVLGVSRQIYEGALAMGHTAEVMFANRLVWARPCIYDELAAIPGMSVFRYGEIGPAVGMECSRAAGMHFDSAEWSIEQASDGELLVSNRFPRLSEVAALRTGVKGSVETTPCSCGNAHARVILA